MLYIPGHGRGYGSDEGQFRTISLSRAGPAADLSDSSVCLSGDVYECIDAQLIEYRTSVVGG